MVIILAFYNNSPFKKIIFFKMNETGSQSEFNL